MDLEDQEAWRTAVVAALRQQDLSQADLARKLDAKPSQISDWLGGKHFPRADRRRLVNELLGIDRDVRTQRPPASVVEKDIPSRLYVSSPITSVPETNYKRHFGEVAEIVSAASEVVGAVEWPGAPVGPTRRLRAAGAVMPENWDWLATAGGLVYIQFEEIEGATGALIELGIALGRKIRTTVILSDRVKKPFLLSSGFERIAEARDDFPNALFYTYSSADAAAGEIRETGAAYFGLPGGSRPNTLY